MAQRALVLGGGGPVGIAWECGIIAGLAEQGVSLADADFIVGTSAGSVVGAQLALGRDPQSLLQAQLRPGESAANPRPGGAPDLMPLMDMMAKVATYEGPPEEIRKELGRFALEAETMSEDQFIASFGAMLASGPWPAKRYACTAVDTASGEFAIWDNYAGVPLSRAIASSCSVPGIYPPITINGRRYMDGGMRSSTNADVVSGSERVVLIAVTGGARGPMAEVAQRRLEGEVNALREAGSEVRLIVPDEASSEAFGLNLMDFRRRAPAAEAGLAQGRREPDALRDFWD
jgi:NTE family protein